METLDMTGKEIGGGGLNSVAIVKEKFFNVEFLRFIFSLFIVYYHLFDTHLMGFYKDLYQNFTYNTRNGHICVEYFFIMAGFFLIYTFNKNLSFIDFVKRKFVRLWPIVAFAFLFGIAGDVFNCFTFKFYPNVFALFLLEGIGITTTKSFLGLSWFISVLFFVSGFYFYIFKNFKKTNYDFAIALMVLFGYTFVVHTTNGDLAERFTTYNNFLCIGLIRGICGMGLGYFIYEIYRHIIKQKYINTLKSAFLYTIAECYLLGFIVYESILHKMSFSNKIILVLAFIILFILFLLKRGIPSRIFNNKFSAVIGRYAFAIYMLHPCIFFFFKKFWIDKHFEVFCTHPNMTICLYTSIVLFVAVFTYHLIEVPAGNYLKKKFFPETI